MPQEHWYWRKLADHEEKTRHQLPRELDEILAREHAAQASRRRYQALHEQRHKEGKRHGRQ